MSKRTSVVLDEVTREAARDLAHRYGCSTSEAIRRAIVRQRDAVLGVPPAKRQERARILGHLFEQFQGERSGRGGEAPQRRGRGVLMLVHLDTDFLIYALGMAGPERQRLMDFAETERDIGLSAVAWYEFSRGPRTPDQLATVRTLLAEDGVVPFSEPIAASAAEVFRQLGSPRRRSADIAIGVTAAALGAILITRNARDFAGIPGLEVEDMATGS